MIDVNKAIFAAIKTGKVTLGSKQTLEAVRTGKAKLIVIASNCPSDIRKNIEHYAKLSRIPMYVHNSSSIDLGIACRKPFTVTAMAIRDAGDSEILRLAEALHGE